ncbi:gliding motility-associated ABC transporter ATP-binding subunit GldA [Cytophagaceae bacterium ABcell3]|nr:gliding motility-associated ABC transporter ATP-binding subunit GldA [Cytophagaceae bacterium ABcell3]
MSVKVKELTRVYGTQYAVNNITFEAQKGQITGFLGPNGAGKSTTMKIATGYIPPSGGSVEVCGYSVSDDPLEVQRRVGYLPEHNPLYLDMYVHEYLRFIGSLHGMRGAKLKERVAEMVEICGLTIEQNKKIGALSKGFRQRVGLAQALIHDPEVLILDEPTTGLDPNQIQDIRTLIKDVSREKTVIFSTHIMQEVEALCDRVIIINRGEIVADDSVAALHSRSSGTKVLSVEFEHEIDVEALRAIPGVMDVKQISTGRYELTTGAEDIRSQIFKAASEHHWALVGLKQEVNSLEKVFRELTNKESV